MSDLIKQHFRATNGLDAGGNKVINVAKADRTVMSDGVNVEYLIQENTIQPWANDRGYPEGFAVTMEKRIWVARADIPAPIPPVVNTFRQGDWISMRVDPKWEQYSSGTSELLPGTYANIDTRVNPVTLVLPKNKVEQGDTIVIRDIGGKPGINQALIKVQDSAPAMIFQGSILRELQLTRPYSMLLLTFTSAGWYVTLSDLSSLARTIDSTTLDAATDVGAQVQSSEYIVLYYTSNKKLTVRLPRYANHGDMITFAEPKGETPLYHFTIKTYDANSSIGTEGATSWTSKIKGGGVLIYDGPRNVWRINSIDMQQRVKIVTDDVVMRPNEAIAIFGANNSTVKTITVTLPTLVAPGDTVRIGMNYMRKGQTVNIVTPPAPAGGTKDRIASTVGLLQFPKRSEYPPGAAWTQVDSLSFNGTSDYPPVLELAYVEATPNNYWIVSENIPTVERVDSTNDTTKARVGVIALATTAQAQATSGHNDDRAITPLTLSQRTATESRTGIAEIATQAEANSTTDDTRIITAKKLNDRLATETMRGVAEIATQAETNGSTVDDRIVTPKKLNGRKATATLDGIIQLVNTGGTPGTSRSDPGTSNGTGVYDHTDFSKAVTPKTLREYKATELASGCVWLATKAEVRNGTPASNNIPTVVTPATLHAKTSTTKDIGLIRIATQAEANAMSNALGNAAITPATLNGRTASYTQTGITRYAIQEEFDGGTLENVAVNPRKIKEYFSRPARMTTRSEAGLAQSGNLWDGWVLNIQVPTETQRGTPKIATQALVNAGTDDVDYLTSKKLQAKKGTESTYGIVKYATRADTNTGTANDVAVSPVHLKYVIQTSADWRAQDNVRGTVRVANGAVAWTGNSTTGSDNTPKESSGYAVSPNGLKQALANYLPLNAKADNSALLNGLTSDQFIRRDINQTVNGSLTLTKVTTSSANIETSAILKSSKVETTGDIRISNATARLLLTSDTNAWSVQAAANSGRIAFISENDTQNVHLSVYNDSRGVTANVKFEAPVINATTQVQLAGTGVIALAGTNSIRLATSGKGLELASSDAGNIIAAEGSTTYKVLTTKNKDSILDSRYVKSAGDTMTGNLTMNGSALVINGSEGWYDHTTTANTEKYARAGSWTVEIKNSAKLATLPGYVVPIREENPLVPGSMIVTGYEEKTGAGGLLAQISVSSDYTYQTWTPYPSNAEQSAKARTHTMWTRVYNPYIKKFDSWMRVYTSATPPTAADIGAPSSVSTSVKTLEVQEWIKIGPVKIYPDRTSQTVKFEWVGD
ncbi:long tail fiber proximal subunit [Klebsiella phage vB_Kpn_F48]|uniref:Long tail fiber proximal subunit n=1 Tax=Klebsiella phage vB_Kpn_F48 TaxID=2070028 RepID=A0A2I6UFN1_9CAUD|nr:tail fiber protein proximal subunit [Klebsiella phage vB_Kpn_F48]AUO78784.1 long tail fiber proximal subunit [Klebsiella phage vB_Kpn_F48]